MSLIILALTMMYGILLPPTECDYEPLTPYIILEYPLSEVADKCLMAKGSVLACTYFNLSPSEIILPKVDKLIITKNIYDILLRHEKGHVNCGKWH